jgi:hypothetical protein
MLIYHAYSRSGDGRQPPAWDGSKKKAIKSHEIDDFGKWSDDIAGMPRTSSWLSYALWWTKCCQVAGPNAVEPVRGHHSRHAVETNKDVIDRYVLVHRLERKQSTMRKLPQYESIDHRLTVCVS